MFNSAIETAPHLGSRWKRALHIVVHNRIAQAFVLERAHTLPPTLYSGTSQRNSSTADQSTAIDSLDCVGSDAHLRIAKEAVLL